MTHIDDGTLVQLRDGGGALMPAAVLEADDHLTSCEACRARLAAAIATECAEDARALMPFAADVEAYRSGRPRAVLRFAAGLAAAIVVATGVWWLSGNARPGGDAAVMAAVDAARARGLSASAAAAAAEEARRTTPGDHLLIGALEEQAGHRERALEEYRALLAEHPGSAVAARLVARVSGHP
jgi:hypothetical protein